ncbi:MAG TPA: nucleotide exchange factor GrpE [bacterium]|nr:nucleotide exchange factor GrpE [bacterium]
MTRIPIEAGGFPEEDVVHRDLPEREESQQETDPERVFRGASGQDSQTTSSKDLESKISQLEMEVTRKSEEGKQNFDRLLRLQAEFENYKKRVSREKEEFSRYAHEKTLREFLPIVDNLYRALEAVKMGGELHSLKTGLDLILQQIKEAFQKLGVTEIKSLGEPFDPTVHEAVMRVDSEGQEDNTVVDELEKGYLLYDRVLRPAKVSVSKKPVES